MRLVAIRIHYFSRIVNCKALTIINLLEFTVNQVGSLGFFKLAGLEGDVVRDKKDILFLRYLILGLALSFTHIFLDYYFGQVTASAIDAVIFLFLLIIFLVAFYGHHFLLAKVLFLSFTNIALFIMTSLVPKGEGVFLIYFPLVTTYFTIFDIKHKRISYFFVLVSLVFLITLELTDYKALGDIRIYESSDHSFLINLISSVLVIVFSVNFLITINKKAEDHLKENEVHLKKLTEEVKDQNNELAKANSELDRFVYSTSHDLKAPLMSILGLINLAEKDAEKHIPIYLDKIKAQVKKLDSFIKDIISYSRNTRVEVKYERIDPEGLIAEIINDLRFMEGADKIEFVKQIDEANHFKSDKSRLSIILSNLISNSIKYHDYEKPDPRVEIDIRTNRYEVNISVKDNGPGIPEKYQKEVFNMFVRASEKSQGSGLGLYIVKEMVEKLNGNLSLTSKEGEGSVFSISLPAK